MDYLVAPDRLVTPNFIIRSFQPGDGALLNEATVSSYDHLKTFMPWANPNTTVEESEKLCRQFRGRYLLAQDFTLGVFNLDESRVLGGTGFHVRSDTLSNLTAEIGMWIRGDQAGRNLGTQVLQALVEWSFTEWPWLRVCWRCDSRNVASARVAIKGGLVQEGLFRGDSFDVEGKERRDTLFFGLTKADWQARKQNQT